MCFNIKLQRKANGDWHFVRVIKTKPIIIPQWMKERDAVMLERGYKFLPESHGAKFSVNGEQKELVYTFREYRYTNDNDVEVITQDWRYYYWNPKWKYFESAGGHRQTCDIEVFELQSA